MAHSPADGYAKVMLLAIATGSRGGIMAAMNRITSSSKWPTGAGRVGATREKAGELQGHKVDGVPQLRTGGSCQALKDGDHVKQFTSKWGNPRLSE